MNSLIENLDVILLKYCNDHALKVYYPTKHPGSGGVTPLSLGSLGNISRTTSNNITDFTSMASGKT